MTDIDRYVDLPSSRRSTCAEIPSLRRESEMALMPLGKKEIPKKFLSSDIIQMLGIKKNKSGGDTSKNGDQIVFYS